MEVTRDQLREWYDTMTVSELMEKLGYNSPVSLYRLLKKANIELKKKKLPKVTLVLEE